MAQPISRCARTTGSRLLPVPVPAPVRSSPGSAPGIGRPEPFANVPRNRFSSAARACRMTSKFATLVSSRPALRQPNGDPPPSSDYAPEADTDNRPHTDRLPRSGAGGKAPAQPDGKSTPDRHRPGPDRADTIQRTATFTDGRSMSAEREDGNPMEKTAALDLRTNRKKEPSLLRKKRKKGATAYTGYPMKNRKKTVVTQLHAAARIIRPSHFTLRE